MVKLGVNVDHVATVREARKTDEPDPVTAAIMVELAGADTEDFNDIIAALYGWLSENTPVERASWTAIKAHYR